MKPKKVYLVWQEDSDGGFFNQYNSISDAVCDADSAAVTEVYVAEPKLLGKYTIRNSIVKVKKGEVNG